MMQLENNNSISTNNNCTGCGVCYTVCPKSAIIMKSNTKGFLRPQVIAEKCINCGLCKMKCHEYHDKKTNFILNTYTAFSTNELIRNESSSGGVFSELARKIMNNGGLVCGAQFNSEFELEHVIINDEKDLPPLRKSKYIEGNFNRILKNIKHSLELGLLVLFVGTPCQCAALRLFLGEEYSNLIICDFICHGVGSPKVFKKFLDYLKSQYGNPISVEFRHKISGEGSYFYYQGENGIYNIRNYTISYPYAYATGQIIADDCTNCKYCTPNRCSDITLGDFVGEHSDYNKSTILINTSKGKQYIESIDSLNLIKQDPEFIKANAWHLTQPNTKNPNRDKVFDKIDILSWQQLEKKYFTSPSKIRLYINAIINKFMNLNGTK